MPSGASNNQLIQANPKIGLNFFLLPEWEKSMNGIKQKLLEALQVRLKILFKSATLKVKLLLYDNCTSTDFGEARDCGKNNILTTVRNLCSSWNCLWHTYDLLCHPNTNNILLKYKLWPL